MVKRQSTVVSKELDSTWRVYAKVWLHLARRGTEAEAEKFSQQFVGRLLPEDLRVEPDTDGTWIVEGRCWNVLAEWKYEQSARGYADNLHLDGFDPEVVSRNSKREHELRAYGVLRLPSQ